MKKYIFWTGFGVAIIVPQLVAAFAYHKIADHLNNPVKVEVVNPVEVKPVKIDPKYIGKKMRRNEPCFCGSGKKFKHCCGSLR